MGSLRVIPHFMSSMLGPIPMPRVSANNLQGVLEVLLLGIQAFDVA